MTSGCRMPAGRNSFRAGAGVGSSREGAMGVRRFSKRWACALAVLIGAPLAFSGVSEGAPGPRARIDKRLVRQLDKLDAADTYGAFVHFRRGTFASHEEVLSDHG